MSTEQYDEIERIFNGTWVIDRDENIEEFMTAAGKKFLSENYLSDLCL